MSVNPFELILLVPSAYKDFSLTRELKSAASLSWAGPRGDTGVIFSDFPLISTKSLEGIEQLVARPGVFAKVGERLLNNTAKFARAVQCYLDSLKENDPLAYCTGKAAEGGWRTQCYNGKCLSTCQFVCIPCLQDVQSAMLPIQQYAGAVEAEVAWCQNLRPPK